MTVFACCLVPFLCQVQASQNDDEFKKTQERIERLEKMIRELDAKNTEMVQMTARLKTENEDLRKQVEQAQDAALSRSTEVLRLRQQVAALEEEKVRLEEEVSRRRGEGGDPTAQGVLVGPSEPMTGFVIGKGKDYGFVLVTIDKKSPKDEPKVGYEFEIVRENKAIALGEVVKLHGEDPKATPKLQVKITRGDVNEIRVGDHAIAKRKLVPSGAVVKENKKIAKISGKVGKDLFAVDAGRNEGLGNNDRVFVYRAGALMGILRLEMVEFETSIGRYIDGTGTGGPGAIDMDCEVRFEKVDLPKKSIIGKIAYCDREIVIDVGTRQQARPGQVYEVRRAGKTVGTVKIKDARYDISYCEPDSGTNRADLQKDDVVELIKD